MRITGPFPYTQRMPLSALSFDDPTAFEEVALPFLLRDEASHNLQLGLLAGVLRGTWSDPVMITISDGGKPLLVAMRTPPRNLVLSLCDVPDAVAELARLLTSRPIARDLPGVLGPARVSDEFGRLWQQETGRNGRLVMRLGVFCCSELIPPPRTEGGPRQADGGDEELLVEWMTAFIDEALPHMRDDARSTVQRWLTAPESELWFWQVGATPVAMAGVGAPTPNGIRISAVYTPEAHRGRGFASNLVAYVTERQLRRRSMCFLHTDLTNPTSNALYARIGYSRVNESHEWAFE